MQPGHSAKAHATGLQSDIKWCDEKKPHPVVWSSRSAPQKTGERFGDDLSGNANEKEEQSAVRFWSPLPKGPGAVRRRPVRRIHSKRGRKGVRMATVWTFSAAVTHPELPGAYGDGGDLSGDAKKSSRQAHGLGAPESAGERSGCAGRPVTKNRDGPQVHMG